jgi:hypothetical protein
VFFFLAPPNLIVSSFSRIQSREEDERERMSADSGGPPPPDTTAGLADDLHALHAAPTFGLNARELILRAAAGADDDGDDLTFAPVGADPARAAAERRAAAVSAGRALARAWPQAEKPFPDLILRSKVPRADRVPVLARLAGEHLALRLDARLGESVDWTAAPAAAALMARSMPAERAAAVAAATAQERALYGAATGGVAYRARAGRATALDAGDEAAAAGGAPPPPPPPRARPLQKSRPAPDPVLASRRAGPDPRPPPRGAKRARAAAGDADPPPPPPPPQDAGPAWTTADPATATDPAAAAVASDVGRELAALLQAAVDPLVASGQCRPSTADAGAASALRKVLAAHGADALSGRREFLEGDARREKLAAFAVACARAAEERAVRADKQAGRADRAARWGAARTAQQAQQQQR